jgi:xylulokinase
LKKRQVVLGIDSSTQSTKAIAVDIETGETLGSGRAAHTGEPTQNSIDWWEALRIAVQEVMDPSREVSAIAVAAQQHGLVTIDAAGQPVRPAPLWNNNDAAEDARRLNDQADFAALTGSRLVASFTIAKLAHLARVHPEDLERTVAVALPHDWLTFKLTGTLVTDRGDASGTGWWSPRKDQIMPELPALAVGEPAARRLKLPEVLGPNDLAGHLTGEASSFLGLPQGIPVAAGTGDNMGAALGLGAASGEMVISLGTSGTAYSVSENPTSDPTGTVAGFADATGRFLPLTCMLNCTGVVDVFAGLFGLDTAGALDLAGTVDAGAGGLLLVPYLGGERTPNLPDATGELLGITYRNLSPATVIRAAVDGVAAGLTLCVEALASLGISAPEIVLVGGGSRHATWQRAIAGATGLPVTVKEGEEHVARGAAVQAAAAVRNETVAVLSQRWRPDVAEVVEPSPGEAAAYQLQRRKSLIAGQPA